MNSVIEQQKKLHNSKEFTVVKVGYTWNFKIPTKGGWKGQVLTYKTKKVAVEFAGKFKANIEG